jgi:hypothetical protein
MQDGGGSFIGGPDDGGRHGNGRQGPDGQRGGGHGGVDDELFEEFEDDYRSGSDYDTEFHRGFDQGFGLDREQDADLDADLDRDGCAGRDDDRRSHSRHGRGKRGHNTEGASFIPLFSRKAKAVESATGMPAVRQQQARSGSPATPARKPGPANPFADIQVYIVPILVAVVIVMVLVVLLLNR